MICFPCHLQDLNSLCNILNAIAEAGLADWYARIELINCISCLVLIEPQSAQVIYLFYHFLVHLKTIIIFIVNLACVISGFD